MRSATLLVFVALLLGACNATTPPAAQPTELERSLVAHARPVNALHRAINLWRANRRDEAIALILDTAPTSPQQLRLDALPDLAGEKLTNAERSDFASMVVTRGLRATAIVRRLVDDASKARAEDHPVEAQRICAALRVLVEVNNGDSAGDVVRQWASTTATLAQAACP